MTIVVSVFVIEPSMFDGAMIVYDASAWAARRTKPEAVTTTDTLEELRPKRDASACATSLAGTFAGCSVGKRIDPVI